MSDDEKRRLAWARHHAQMCDNRAPFDCSVAAMEAEAAHQEERFVAFLRANTVAIYDAWKAESCPGTWNDYLADYMERALCRSKTPQEAYE